MSKPAPALERRDIVQLLLIDYRRSSFQGTLMVGDETLNLVVLVRPQPLELRHMVGTLGL